MCPARKVVLFYPFYREETDIEESLNLSQSYSWQRKGGASIQTERFFFIIMITVTVKTKVQGHQSPSQKFHKNSQVPGYRQMLAIYRIYHRSQSSHETIAHRVYRGLAASFKFMPLLLFLEK